MVKNTTIETSKRFNLLSASGAFILWGGWAYYVNYNPLSSVGFFSGLVQGAASFIITLFMTYMVTWLFRRIKKQYLQLVLPAVITVSFTGSCLVSIHFLIGTPAIFYTVAPALSVGLIFCILTSFKLQSSVVIKEI